ncbi:matrixin family metalloprotease [Pendulispora albinea]|uniref:Matrixin family metalloprotease n=1 Tax=Pendulispora albinea TaxID=2741071 RepID=A0ABZ2M492_9BACT
MKLERTLLLLAVLGATMSAAPSTYGFCRRTTGREPNDPSDTNRCTGWDEQARNACCPYGKPLYWKNACIGFSLQKNASREVSLSDAQRVFTRAFATWTATTCSLDGVPVGRVSLDVKYLGPVECGKVQYNDEGPNQNVIVFRDTGWDHLDPTNTLGLTTVQYDTGSGEILGADMEINASQPRPLSVSDSPPAEALDLLAIATHEAGHFLGFAHSVSADATMYASYRGVSMRDLSPDDSSGICNVYNPNQTRSTGDGRVRAEACDERPRNGYTGACDQMGASIEGGGCAASPRSSSSSPSSGTTSYLAMALTALSFAVLRRVRSLRAARAPRRRS